MMPIHSKEPLPFGQKLLSGIAVAIVFGVVLMIVCNAAAWGIKVALSIMVATFAGRIFKVPFWSLLGVGFLIGSFILVFKVIPTEFIKNLIYWIIFIGAIYLAWEVVDHHPDKVKAFIQKRFGKPSN
jgi:hypothetical protein